MDHVLGLKCTICGQEYAVDETEYVCPKHGDDGILDVVYDYQSVGRSINVERLAEDRTASIWRYLPLLPVDPSTVEIGMPVRAIYLDFPPTDGAPAWTLYAWEPDA